MRVNAEIIEYQDGDFKYVLNTETQTAELAKVSVSAKEVVIPESVSYEGDVYHVTSLAAFCFNDRSSLTSITIPSSVITLGDYCFWYCSSLTSITIPSSVTSLGDMCFKNCSSLTYITIPSSVTTLGDHCFAMCSSLTAITIPSSVTSLGRSCFFGCSSLTSIDIPSSVKSFGKWCFCDCSSLTAINIPSSVTGLGTDCFGGCSALASITVDANNPVFDSREKCNAIIETQSNTLLYGCKNTVIPSSVTNLGNGCFQGCSSLTFITIPSSVTSLGDHCFGGCSSLKSINIPSSVTSLGGYCFGGCSALASITVDANNPVFDSREKCNAIIETQSNTLLYGCKNTIIPSSVTRLEDYCFSDYDALTSIRIPSSVTSLGDCCFSGCSALQTVTCEIPTAIEGNFFNWGTPIEQATLYVPEASLTSYKTTYPWSEFGTILPISGTGIESIESITAGEPTIEAIYNFEGKRMNSMSRGLNILRMSDGTTRKVLNLRDR